MLERWILALASYPILGRYSVFWYLLAGGLIVDEAVASHVAPRHFMGIFIAGIVGGMVFSARRERRAHGKEK